MSSTVVALFAVALVPRDDERARRDGDWNVSGANAAACPTSTARHTSSFILVGAASRKTVRRVPETLLHPVNLVMSEVARARDNI